MTLAGIIWDIDGTLGDTLPLCLAAFRHVYRRRLGRDFTDAEIVAGFGATEAGTIRALIPDGWEAAEAEYLDEYARHHDELASTFPGIPEVLAALHDRGLRQAVVTGKGPRSATITLDRLGLAPYFDRVETGSIDGPIKPAGIGRILAAWDVSPVAVASIGDTAYDVAAATEAGVIPLRAAWSSTPGGQDDHIARPAATFATPADLLTWVDATWPG